MWRTWPAGRWLTGPARRRNRVWSVHQSSVLGLRSNDNPLENDKPPVSQPTPRTVAIVLDPGYSSRLASLAARAAVWIVDSPENRPAIESLWTARRTRGAEYDVTVFRTIPGLSNEVLEKLEAIRPRSIGQASRISGVTPAAVAILLTHIGLFARRAAGVRSSAS